ncbi:hypothetical protein D3C86_1654860 [compost metagenome]
MILEINISSKQISVMMALPDLEAIADGDGFLPFLRVGMWQKKHFLKKHYLPSICSKSELLMESWAIRTQKNGIQLMSYNLLEQTMAAG